MSDICGTDELTDPLLDDLDKRILVALYWQACTMTELVDLVNCHGYRVAIDEVRPHVYRLRRHGFVLYDHGYELEADEPRCWLLSRKTLRMFEPPKEPTP